jgi:hypothetical protein
LCLWKCSETPFVHLLYVESFGLACRVSSQAKTFHWEEILEGASGLTSTKSTLNLTEVNKVTKSSPNVFSANWISIERTPKDINQIEPKQFCQRLFGSFLPGLSKQEKTDWIQGLTFGRGQSDIDTTLDLLLIIPHAVCRFGPQPR